MARTSCPPPTAGELGRLWDTFTTLLLPKTEAASTRITAGAPTTASGASSAQVGEERVSLVLEHGAGRASRKKRGGLLSAGVGYQEVRGACVAAAENGKGPP